MHYNRHHLNDLCPIVYVTLTHLNGLKCVELLIILAVEEETSDYRFKLKALAIIPFTAMRVYLCINADNFNASILEHAATYNSFYLMII